MGEKKVPPGIGQMLSVKRAAANDYPADFRKKMRVVSKELRRIYHLCRRKIRYAERKRRKRGKSVEVVLYSHTWSGPRKGPDYVPELMALLKHPVQGGRDIKLEKKSVGGGVKTTIRLKVW